jgi:hypothetical protein
MVDHIYGRGDILTRKDRPHLFIKELDLYIQFFKDALDEAVYPLSKQKATYLSSFEKNLNEGIAYYREFFTRLGETEVLEALAQQEIGLNQLCASKMPEASLV